LPDDVKALMSIVDNTEDFAEAAVAALRGPVLGPGAHLGLLRLFGGERFQEMVTRLPTDGGGSRAGRG
jgi:hypothetical protein